MGIISRLKYLYLAYFSQPKSDRVVYRAIARQHPSRILEIGIGTAARSVRLICLAQQMSAGEAVRYAAIDLFESRPVDLPGLALKEAHRLLHTTGAVVQLIPGDPVSALARAANALQKIDLVVISSSHDEVSLERAWFYLPRMLHGGSRVYLESPAVDGTAVALRLLAPAEVEARALASRPRRAAQAA